MWAGRFEAVDLQITFDTIGGVAVLSITGELDLSTLPQFRNAVVRLVGDHPTQTVAIDVDGVFVLDDTGVGVLLGAAGRARENGGDLAVVCTDERLLRRFAVLRLDCAVDVVTSVHDLASRHT